MRVRYPLLALLLYAAAWGLGGVRAAATGRPVEFKAADAWGYYAYLPAVLIDGNVEFQNQPIYGADPSAEGQTLNRWPIGLALTIAPAFLLAHALAVRRPAGGAITGPCSSPAFTSWAPTPTPKYTARPSATASPGTSESPPSR